MTKEASNKFWTNLLGREDAQGSITEASIAEVFIASSWA